MTSASMTMVRNAVLAPALMIVVGLSGCERDQPPAPATAPVTAQPGPSQPSIISPIPADQVPIPHADFDHLEFATIDPSAPTDKAAETVADPDRAYALSSPWVAIPTPVTGTDQPDTHERNRFRRALSDANNYRQGVSAMCFDPGLALRIGTPPHQSTYLICLMCQKMERLPEAAGQPAQWWDFSEPGCDFFKALFVDCVLLHRR